MMEKCHICGKLKAIGRACVCAAWVISVALGREPHVDEQRAEPPPVVAAVAASTTSHVHRAGGLRWNTETGRYELIGYALSTHS